MTSRQEFIKASQPTSTNNLQTIKEQRRLIAELIKTLRTARNQVVSFALEKYGVERAIETVEHIDDAIEKAKSTLTQT